MTASNELAHPVELLKRMLYWRMAFFSVIILLAGMAIGASGAYIWLSKQKAKPTPPPAVSVNRVMRRLHAQLNLTPAQVAQIRPLLRQCLAQLDEVRNQARPQINQHLRQMNQGITAVLDEKQKQQWKGIARRLMALLQNNTARRATVTRPRAAPGPSQRVQHPTPLPVDQNE